MNEDEFDWCIEQTLFFGEEKDPKYDPHDGGDLTNMVLDRFPELANGIKGSLKKQLLGFIACMSA